MALVVAACGSGTDTDETVIDEPAVGNDTSSGTPETSAEGADASGDAGEAGEEDVVSEAVVLSIVDTGQSQCYDETGAVACPQAGEELFGQDGNYAGTQPSYTDNGDSTVTDNVTGLIWQQDPGEKMTYAQAASGADSFELAGYDDWRLPSIKELYSLIDFAGTDPSGCPSSNCEATPFIDTGFFDFQYGDPDEGERMIDSQWATSTIYVGTTMGGDETMFGVNFADGRIKGYGLSDPRGGEKTFFVSYVRGDPGYGENAYVDGGDGTVTDTASGLMWQQDDSTDSMDWSEALAYCAAADTGGHDDWRLPDAKELQGIVDYTRSPSTTDSAAIDPILSASPITDEGGGTDYGSYWTGTTHASLMGGANAVYVAFGEALGWMENPQTGEYTLLDVHGAGAQRSDPKTGDAADYPYGHGPQGDVIRIENLVRCVRGGDLETVTGGEVVLDDETDSESSSPQTPAETEEGGPLAAAAAQLGVTERELAAALGDPGSGPPDFEMAAAALGVSVDALMEAVGAPPTNGP
ncbi:MAG: DUF1566 domain-containing protein [Actinomycetia bacterium]|nr:DUF1566 domain-containing protein [Actinomycetes bacterium]